MASVSYGRYVAFRDEYIKRYIKDTVRGIFFAADTCTRGHGAAKGLVWSIVKDAEGETKMGTRCRFVREQRHVCGDNYMEIDLYPISEREKGASLSAKRRQASSRIQQNLNARNARRYFIQLLNANFTESDIHWTGTYDDAHLPDSIEQADHDLGCFAPGEKPKQKAGLACAAFYSRDGVAGRKATAFPRCGSTIMWY